MKLLTSGIIVLASVGLLFGACSKESKTSDSATPNAAAPTAETAPPSTNTAKAEGSTGSKSKGGDPNQQAIFKRQLPKSSLSGASKFC